MSEKRKNNVKSNEEKYEDQRAAVANLLESEFAGELLKVHHEFSKPSFALSRWLLAVTGAVAVALLTNASAAADLLGKGWLLAIIALLLLGGMTGLFAVYREGTIRARVASITGIFVFADTAIPKFVGYDRGLALHAQALGIDKPEGVQMPDQEKITDWFRYPDTWYTRWAYGQIADNDKGAFYKSIMAYFAQQAFASKLQLLLVVSVFGVALADIGQQQLRGLFAAPVMTSTQSTNPAAVSPATATHQQ